MKHVPVLIRERGSWYGMDKNRDVSVSIWTKKPITFINLQALQQKQHCVLLGFRQKKLG